jgi:hypothetical protein
MGYRVTVDGQSWLVDDLTLDEVCDIEQETGTTWLVISPMRSAKHARAIIPRLMTHVGDLTRRPSLEQARQRVGVMTITQVLECITEDETPDEDSSESGPKETSSPDLSPESETSPPA